VIFSPTSLSLAGAAVLAQASLAGCQSSAETQPRRDPSTVAISLGVDGEVKLDGASVGPMTHGEGAVSPLPALADAIRALPRTSTQPWKAEVEVPKGSDYVDLVRLVLTAGQGSRSWAGSRAMAARAPKWTRS
jgi:hypothetical protein